MKHLSLFSGIGGFDLAADWMGWENIAQVEKDKYCLKLLKQNFPKTKQYGDITEFNGKEYTGTIDIISGGFPCQPFIVAGKRKGKDDSRFLWPEMLRIIREIAPRWVVGENVSGIIPDGTADGVVTSLENIGYKTEIFVLPASAAGAKHRRDRVWFISHAVGERRRQGSETVEAEKSKSTNCTSLQPGYATNPGGARLQRCGKKSFSKFKYLQGELERGREALEIIGNKSKPRICGIVNGFPGRVDRVKGLGNAVCPPLVYEIFKIIERADNELFKYCEGCNSCPSPCNSENNYNLPF